MSVMDKHTGKGINRTRIGGADEFSAPAWNNGTGLRAAAAAAVLLAALIGEGAAASVNAGQDVLRTSGAAASRLVREVHIASIRREEGRISFENEPLLRVIDELNRTSERKLKVDRSDPRYRRLRVTGQFRTGRPEVIVEYMRAAGLKVLVKRDRDGNILLRLLADSSSG